MLWVLFSVAIVIAVYFATRFFLLKKAMKEANREFQDILKDIQQNQILHMAMPDKELENMELNQTSIKAKLQMARQTLKVMQLLKMLMIRLDMPMPKKRMTVMETRYLCLALHQTQHMSDLTQTSIRLFKII